MVSLIPVPSPKARETTEKSDPFISVSEVVHPEIGGFSSTRENTFPYIVVILFYLLNLQV